MFIHATDEEMRSSKRLQFYKTLKKNLYASKMPLYVADITMDRDQDGTNKICYDLITEGRGTPSSNLWKALKNLIIMV